MRDNLVNASATADWDRRFAGDDYLFGTEPSAFLLSQAQRLPRGWQALVVADGEGRNGAWLAGQGLVVTSMDASPVGLAKARALAESRHVALRTICCDIAEWDWERERYDVVVAIFVQFAPPALRRAMFEGMRKTLRPGGLLLLQGYRPEQLNYRTGGPAARENLYTAELLRDAFAGMEIVHLQEHDSVIEEGAAHCGMSALIDLVARQPDA